jgi:hypothetical protein
MFLCFSPHTVFWQISKVGVKPFKKILVECHRLVMSSKEGVSQGHENDKVNHLFALLHFVIVGIF